MKHYHPYFFYSEVSSGLFHEPGGLFKTNTVIFQIYAIFCLLTDK